MDKKEALKLTAPAPLNDGGRRYNKLYFILGIAGALIGIPNGGIGGLLLLGMFGLVLAFILKRLIIENKLYNLRKLEFYADKAIPYDEMIGKLIPVLTPLGMLVEKNIQGGPMITYQGIMYDLNYSDNNAFTLYWRKSVLKAICGFKRTVANYRKAVIAMGIIAYHAQQACLERENGTDWI